MKKEKITLKCGIEAEVSKYNGIETLSVSLDDLYEGYEHNITLLKFSELFKELSDMGYKNVGCSIDYGYYNSVDGRDISQKWSKELYKTTL